jgi:hypothetical protein
MAVIVDIAMEQVIQATVTAMLAWRRHGLVRLQQIKWL